MSKDRGNTLDMTMSAGTPQRAENNPLYDAQVVHTGKFGEHEVALCDDGSTIVNGEHVCVDSVGTDEELPGEPGGE